MAENQKVFKIITAVMIVVCVLGIFMGLSLTAQMVSDLPENEVLTTRANSLLDCRGKCINMCREAGKRFEHGSFDQDFSSCECFCY